MLDHLRRNQLIATSNLRINTPIEYKRSRANHSTERSYSILTRVAVIDESLWPNWHGYWAWAGTATGNRINGSRKRRWCHVGFRIEGETFLGDSNQIPNLCLDIGPITGIQELGKSHGRQQTDCRHYNYQLHQGKSMLAEDLVRLLQPIKNNLIRGLSLGIKHDQGGQKYQTKWKKIFIDLIMTLAWLTELNE